MLIFALELLHSFSVTTLVCVCKQKQNSSNSENTSHRCLCSISLTLVTCCPLWILNFGIFCSDLFYCCSFPERSQMFFKNWSGSFYDNFTDSSTDYTNPDLFSSNLRFVLICSHLILFEYQNRQKMICWYNCLSLLKKPIFQLFEDKTHSFFLNNKFLRERGMASNPKMEYQVFLCIFQKN